MEGYTHCLSVIRRSDGDDVLSFCLIAFLFVCSYLKELVCVGVRVRICVCVRERERHGEILLVCVG